MSNGLQPGEWTFEWLTRWDEVWADSFQSQWKAWMAQSANAHVFFEPPIIRAWHDTYMPLRKIEPRFLVARRGSDHTVFLPLVLDRGGWKDAWQRAILPAGHCEFDYHDPIAVGQMDESCWRSFWQAFEQELLTLWRGTFEVASIGRVRGDVLPVESRGDPVDEVPWLDVEHFKSMEEFLAGGSRKNLRHQFNRKVVKLEQEGDANVYIFGTQEAKEARRSIGLFSLAHAARWPYAGTPYIFFDYLIEHCLSHGLLVLSELRINSQCISRRVCFKHKRRLHDYVTAYPEDMARYSPGMVHFGKLVEWALHNGCTMIDIGRGKEEWKLRWTADTLPLYSLRWDNKGVRSAVSRMWQESIRPHVMRAKRRLLGRKSKLVSD